MQIFIEEDLLLSPLTEADAQEIHLLIEQNRFLLTKYLYWADSIEDQASTSEYLRQRIYSKYSGAAWYKIIFKNQASGVFGIKEINTQTQTAEIGYWLSAHCQGKGVMTKVVNRICKYLKNSHNTQEIQIHCLSENKGSIAVAERAGGVHRRTVPNYYTIDGKEQDLKIYTIAL